MRLDPSDIESLRPVILAVVQSVLGEIESGRARITGCDGKEQLGYAEPEAAHLLGICQHVLRDMRLRGEIKARKAGKRNLYSRAELVRWLEG